jgi:ParB-like chromosome segregation protein Spo0J
MIAAPTISILETKSVKLKDLRPYPANPRNGDVDLIRESVRQHGQFRAMVVNKRSMEVLAGNHLLHAMLAEGFTEGLCHFVDVDDEEAARIVLIDNRASDKAGYDDGLLAELLQSLPDLSGTGYDDQALAVLVSGDPNFEPVGEDEQGRLDQLKPVTCPNCGHEFRP